MLPGLNLLLVAATVASTVRAFQDSSPFLLLSTHAPDTRSPRSAQVIRAESLEEQLLESFTDCDSSIYVFLRQPGLQASDVRQMGLASRVAGKYKSVVDIPEVIGDVHASHWASTLQSRCNLEEWTMAEYLADSRPLTSREPALISVTSLRNLEPDVVSDLAVSAFDKVFSFLTNHTSHTIVLTAPANPREPSIYMDLTAEEDKAAYEQIMLSYEDIMHSDLKRDVLEREGDRRAPKDAQAGLPLFERYQFLSPAIFMGLAVTVLLFSILYVGISAIAGLEVSYGAFKKEMGPQAQNKGKQQ